MPKINKLGLIVIVSWLLYFPFTLLFCYLFDYSIFFLSIFPVVLTSSWIGSKYSLLSAFVVIIYNFSIFYSYGNYAILSSVEFIGGSAVILILAWIVGKLKDINDRLNSELKKRKKMEKELSERERKIKKLHDIASKLETCEEKEEIYNLTLKAAEDIFDLEISEIEVPEDDEMIVINSSSKFPEEGLQPVPLHDSIAGRSYLNNRSFLIKDMEHNRFANPSSDEYKSGLTVPIGNKAVFQAASDEKNAFSEEDINVVKLLANHAAEALERVEIREKSDFLHSLLRHDVKNKVEIIQGYHELMDNFDLKDDFKEYLEKAKEETRNSMELIEKIRTLRKMDEEKRKDIEVNEALESAINRNVSAASERDIKIDHEKIGCKVKAGTLIIELFSNLIENSIKHSEGDLIQISGIEREDKCKVLIEDDGKGIPDSEKEDIFKKGFKKGENSGSGLGMYLVKEIANNYGATIEAKDSDLGGVLFEITFEKAG